MLPFRLPRLTLWSGGLLLALLLMLASYTLALNAYWVGDDYNYVRPKDWPTVINFFNPVGRATYRPLNFLIWAGDYWLFGDQPLGWRLTRLAIHSVNIVSAALLVHAITGRTKLAILAAALFAVHPAQTETVTWAGGQADISFALAWLPALWMFVRWRQGASSKWWLGAGILGFVSMFGKEAAITLPVASLWLDLVFGREWQRWPGRRDKGWWRDLRLYPRLIRDHSLFIAASGFMVAMRLYLFFTDQGELMYGVEEQLGFLSRSVDVITGYILLATGAWWLPQQILIWPLAAKLAIIVAALLIIIALVRWLGKIALFAAVWPIITLALTLQAVANRWFYVPARGVGIMVAAIWMRLWDDYAARPGGSMPRRLVVTLAALVLVWWSALTAIHNDIWWQSGEEARRILGQVRRLHPDPPRPSTFYMANPPPTYKGALLFNSGFGSAIYLLYQDWDRIKSYNLAEDKAQVEAALADPGKVGPNPVFLRYEAGNIVEYPSLQALVEAEQADR